MSLSRTLALSLLLIGCGVTVCDVPKPKDGILEARGVVIPASRAAVTASVAGRVNEMLVREGERVEKGAVLFRLDDSLASTEVQAAEAQLKLAQARLKEVDVLRAEQALADVEVGAAQPELKLREDELAQLMKVPHTQERRNKAEEAVRLARTRVEKAKVTVQLMAIRAGVRKQAAEAEIEASKAEYARRRILLDAATVRSPMDGVVLRVNVQKGGFTNPALHGLASAAVLCEIADPNQALVVVEIGEADVGRVEIGQPVTVRTASQPGATLKGKVETISSVVERGSVRVTVSVPVEGKRVLFGASAAVKFLPKQ